MSKDQTNARRQAANVDQLAQRLRSIQSAAEAGAKHLMCPMAKILRDMDDETGKCLYDVLNDDVTSTASIIRAMKQAGRGVARQTISDYREGRCPCSDEDKCGLDERFGN